MAAEHKNLDIGHRINRKKREKELPRPRVSFLFLGGRGPLRGVPFPTGLTARSMRNADSLSRPVRSRYSHEVKFLELGLSKEKERKGKRLRPSSWTLREYARSASICMHGP